MTPRSIRGSSPYEDPTSGYFLAEAALAAAACCCLTFEALLALDSFCEDFFWFAFGDLSPMILFG